jgi:hypothetical protein
MNEKLSNKTLIKYYINICNYALFKHRHLPLLKEILAGVNRIYSQGTITFIMIDDENKPLAYFSTRFVDGMFTPVVEGEHSPDIKLKIRRSYLENVVENADDYMAHPTKLDWDWLTGEVKPEKKR